MPPGIYIQQEISQISSKLTELPEKHPYIVPDGYFEELPNQIMDNIRTENMSAREEIMQLSPVLAGLKEKKIYQIENEYFAQPNIHLPQIQSNASKIIPVKKWQRLAIAASFIGMLSLSVFLYNKYEKSQDVISSGLAIKTEAQFNKKLHELKSEDILNYLNQYASVYDQYEMEKMIDPHRLPEEKEYVDDPVLNELMQDLNDADINM